MADLTKPIHLNYPNFDKVVNNEAGVPEKITSIKLGYWIWVLSSFTMAVGNSILFYLKDKKE